MSQEANKLYHQAKALYEQGDFPASTLILEQLLITFPTMGKAHWLIAQINHKHLQDYSKAELAYKEAIRNNPEVPQIYLDYASLMFLLDKHSELIALLNKASEIQGVPQDNIQLLYGMLREKKMEYDNAIEHYKRGIIACFDNDRILDLEGAINRCMIKKKYS